jgi:hypothetical protein
MTMAETAAKAQLLIGHCLVFENFLKAAGQHYAVVSGPALGVLWLFAEISKSSDRVRYSPPIGL